MAMSVIRFDLRTPDMSPAEVSEQYAAAVEMSTWADQQGFDMCVVSEHHGTDDNYMPSPLVVAGAIAGATSRIPLNVAALLVPLHDPVRLAEDIAVLDLLSGGRLSIVAGLGYRPVEYEMFDQQWKGRGRRLDECLEVMVKAWTGEPFEYRGATVRVTPRPLQDPHPTMFVGGSTPAAAKRAARFGMNFFPSFGDHELGVVYRQECERLGIEPGIVVMPRGPAALFVSDDPDRLWAQIGDHLLHDANTYHQWQSADIRSHVHSHAGSIEQLRAEGVYQILTPDECVAMNDEVGPFGSFTHHPLCGGTPADVGWASLQLFADKVRPRLAAPTT